MIYYDTRQVILTVKAYVVRHAYFAVLVNRRRAHTTELPSGQCWLQKGKLIVYDKIF